MFKSALRVTPRCAASSKPAININATRRLLSTAPPSQKSRSWKSSAVRWGLAGAGVWYYSTSDIFAEEPEGAIRKLEGSIQNVKESNLPTIDAVMEEKRLRQAQEVAEKEKKEHEEAAKAAASEDGVESAQGEEGMDGLEDEAGQQGAFNPETGEINWDCPCLGGMAHGPCGEEFKAAFSCFVYSKEEPKGVECIEKFKGMQDCFREHPEMYASELEDDEAEVEEELRAREAAKASEEQSSKPSKDDGAQSSSKPLTPTTQREVESRSNPAEERHRDGQTTSPEKVQPLGDEGGELVPRAAHDATSKN